MHSIPYLAVSCERDARVTVLSIYKDILYLSRVYTPASTAGGIRAGRFVDAQVKEGRSVLVATVGEKAVLEDCHSGLRICRVTPEGQLPDRIRRGSSSWPWWRPLPGPDPESKCSVALASACDWLIRYDKVDLIYVMSPPFSLSAVAWQLAMSHKIPFIVELDDAWHTGMYWPYRSAMRRRLAKKWEYRCLGDAEKIVVVTETHKKILTESYPNAISDKIVCIPHSFDNTAGAAIKHAPDVNGADEGKFTIAYVGQVRGVDNSRENPLSEKLRLLSQWVRRTTLGANFCERLRLDWMSPKHLIFAAGRAAKRNPDFREKVRIAFVGEKYPETDLWAEQAGLGKNLRQYGPLPPGQAQRFVEQADLLVVNLYGIVGMDYHWCVPTKIYTYLGAGKAILALLPPGEAADIIRRAGTGFVVEPDDDQAITEELLKLFRQHQKGGIPIEPNWEFINQFALERQQKQFVEVVGSVFGKQTILT